MAAGKEKINEVGFEQDDDPTAELEVLSETASKDVKADNRVEAESDDPTFNVAEADTELGEGDETVSSLKSELKSHTVTIGGLQFEIQQLRSRRTGLEKKVQALEEVVNNVTEELTLAHEKQLHTSDLLKERGEEIESLRSQLSGREQALKESAEHSQMIETRGQHWDTTRTSSEKLTSGLSEINNTPRTSFDAAMKTRMRLDRQVKEANDNNARLATELESQQALISDYEQVIQELRKSEISAASQRAEISAGTARLDANDEPHELALLVSLNDKASSQYSIRTGRLSLGSSSDNDIRIKSAFISRHHAEIVSGPTDSILRDLNSTNGTYVNSSRIKRHALRNGDSITIGKHRFKFVKKKFGASEHESEFNGVRSKLE